MAERAAIIRLRTELERDVRACAALVADLHARATALSADDPVRLGYTAVTLHQLYTGLESGFERIVRTLEGSLPTGPDAHAALLRDMTLELPDVRPAVLRAETAEALRPLLRFRHFVRHAYAVAWDVARLQENLADAYAAWALVSSDLAEFLRTLDGIIAEL